MDRPTDLEVLMHAADLADGESMRTWRSPELEVEIKPDGSPVSATDKLIERRLRELLAELRPNDPILGEEEGGPDSTSGRRWIVDPIDGTSSYVRGGRAWGFLLALEIDGRPVAGIVSMPALGVRWWGTTEDGARFRNAPDATPTAISVTDHRGTDGMRWSSGPIVDELEPDEQERLAVFEGRGNYIAREEWTSYPALMVADGSLDLAVHFGQRWDHAALAAVVVAAGGDVVYDGQPSADRRFAATFTNAHLP